MKDFEHPNVLGLVGVCFDSPDGFPCIILPYMAQGNLRSYLKSRRVHVTDVHTLPEVKCGSSCCKLLYWKLCALFAFHSNSQWSCSSMCALM